MPSTGKKTQKAGCRRAEAIHLFFRILAEQTPDADAVEELRATLTEAAPLGVTSIQDMSDAVPPERCVSLLAKDGRVAFISNRDGLPALYVRDTARGGGAIYAVGGTRNSTVAQSFHAAEVGCPLKHRRLEECTHRLCLGHATASHHWHGAVPSWRTRV